MKTTSLNLTLASLASLLLAAATTLATATDSSNIRVAFRNTGLDPDATGTLVAVMNPKRSALTMQVSKLAPGGQYKLVVGSELETSFVADAGGRARLTFASPGTRKSLALDFDIRGKLVSIRHEGTVVLQAVVSGSGEPEGSSVLERVELQPLSSSKDGAARTQFQLTRSGRRTFQVSLANVRGSNWSVYVDGIGRGQLEVRGRTARLRFDNNPRGGSGRLLEFDPRGHIVDIAQGTNLVFSGRMEAKARDVTFASPSLRTGSIPSTGLDADGIAAARFRVTDDATRSFSVELEDVATGSYEFLADGALQGSIQVVTNGAGTRGEIEFSNRSDDSGELPLNFDPTNAVFLVRQGAAVFFQGKLANSTLVTGTNNAPAFIQENLTSTGLVPGAHGDARFETDLRGRQKFSVEIEDVPAGSYSLWVGQVQRGSLIAALAGSKVKGQIEFSGNEDKPGELALNFEPRGALIEVKSSAGVLFAHTFGAGNGSNSNSATPLRLEVPLFNLGLSSSGTAKAQYKRDDRGRRGFEVQAEHVPAGNYTLVVGGTDRGLISVTTVGGDTRGTLRFEDEPGTGELRLSFDPLGQTIAVGRDGSLYFQRTFPTGQ